ncbi:MAG: hypothetical protein QXV39_07990 [Candidatus Caldarchaeum sp.]
MTNMKRRGHYFQNREDAFYSPIQERFHEWGRAGVLPPPPPPPPFSNIVKDFILPEDSNDFTIDGLNLAEHGNFYTIYMNSQSATGYADCRIAFNNDMVDSHYSAMVHYYDTAGGPVIGKGFSRPLFGALSDISAAHVFHIFKVGQTLVLRGTGDNNAEPVAPAVEVVRYLPAADNLTSLRITSSRPLKAGTRIVITRDIPDMIIGEYPLGDSGIIPINWAGPGVGPYGAFLRAERFAPPGNSWHIMPEGDLTWSGWVRIYTHDTTQVRDWGYGTQVPCEDTGYHFFYPTIYWSYNNFMEFPAFVSENCILSTTDDSVISSETNAAISTLTNTYLQYQRLSGTDTGLLRLKRMIHPNIVVAESPYLCDGPEEVELNLDLNALGGWVILLAMGSCRRPQIFINDDFDLSHYFMDRLIYGYRIAGAPPQSQFVNNVNSTDLNYDHENSIIDFPGYIVISRGLSGHVRIFFVGGRCATNGFVRGEIIYNVETDNVTKITLKAGVSPGYLRGKFYLVKAFW